MRSLGWRRKALLAAGTAEVALRLLTPYPIHGAMANRIEDAELGYRMDPALDGIDTRGFRNPDGIDVVAIGDSHTYGYNVEPSASWPARLAELTGQSVYNLGIGGYGALHYLPLVEEALARQPRVIIVGLYLANVCRLVATVPTPGGVDL